jgi:hypothetical protein
MSNPMDASAGPRLSLRTGAAGDPLLEVTSYGGRIYSICVVPDLARGWHNSVVLTNFNGDGFTNSFGMSPTESSAFYQLQISLRVKPASSLPSILRARQPWTLPPLNLSRVAKDGLFRVP